LKRLTINQGMEGVLRVILVMTGAHSTHVPRGFEAIAPQLFNLEPYAEPEKPLDVNLGIPQLEWFTD